jgi:hypothetical protein
MEVADPVRPAIRQQFTERADVRRAPNFRCGPWVS